MRNQILGHMHQPREWMSGHSLRQINKIKIKKRKLKALQTQFLRASARLHENFYVPRMMGASDAIEGIAIHCDDIIVHEMNAVASADSICFVG